MLKYVLSYFVNRLLMRRVDFTNDESSTLNTPIWHWSVSSLLLHFDFQWDESIQLKTNQIDPCESCRFVNLLHPCIVYNILTIDRLLHDLRTWKVHVVMFSYLATHFHSSPTCTPLDFRYVNKRFDFRCDNSLPAVDELQRFGCIGHVCLQWLRGLWKILNRLKALLRSVDIPAYSWDGFHAFFT